MPRVSIRTLALMVELLIAVIAVQFLTMPRPASADAVWLAGDCLALPPAPAGEMVPPAAR